MPKGVRLREGGRGRDREGEGDRKVGKVYPHPT